MLELFWEMRQQNKIREASSEANMARHAANDAANRINSLEDSINRLLRVNRAMWELLRDGLNLSEEQLLEKVKEIDQREGTLDGKPNRTQVSPCGACGRPMNSSLGRCIYCGAAAPEADAFDKVK